MNEKITEKTVRDRILRIFSPYSNTMFFNIVGVADYNYEIDLLQVLPSNFCREFEIKVSKVDIQNEVKKTKKHKELLEGRKVRLGRNKALHQGREGVWIEGEQVYTTGFHPIKQFYVVVPDEDDLVKYALALPDHIGVIQAGQHSYCWEKAIIRKARNIKIAIPISVEQKMDLYRRANHKMWNMYYNQAAGRK